MNTTARNTLAIIGAGPIGLEAAAAALEAGLDVHVFERGDVGAHVQAWGHIRMFTPWSMNIGPASARLLKANGWSAPAPGEHPSGVELAERLLLPLAATPELSARVHRHAQVVHVSRRGTLKGEHIGRSERAGQPFRLLVRDAGGRESFLHAHALIDASGVFGQPNWAGTGGIPARGELYLAPQMSYHPDDVLGLKRERHAGKRTLVIGDGASAATTVTALAQLGIEAEGTSVLWVTRETGGPFAGEQPDDPLPLRAALYAAAHALHPGGHPAVACIGGAEVEAFEYNTGTHRYRVTLQIGGQARVEEVDQVIVNTGFGPDDSITRELQVHSCYATRGAMKLAASLLAGGSSDCLTAPAGGAELLSHPEPGFYVLGAKAYGRSNAFLLRTGYEQTGMIVEKLAAEARAQQAG